MAIVFIASCTDKFTEELSLNAPVYMSYDELRSAVSETSPRELVNPGKIYFKGDYLYVVEYMEGIHVIDVSNPASPQNKAFVEVIGCVDIAIKDNSLYADSYVDLVVMDVSDINNIKESGRLEDVLPYTLPKAENDQLPYGKIDKNKGIVVGWTIEREKRELETESYPYYGYPLESASDGSFNGSGGSGGSSAGIAGSMARFGIYSNYLYTAYNYNSLHIFNISTPSSPVSESVQYISGTIETMFIHDGHIFFGMPTGMLVYTLKVPSVPQFVGAYSHITSCDPVVVQDSIAYVTLRGGTTCGGTVNRLDMVRMMNNYTRFDMIASASMTGPYGLGVDKNVLFVCDGESGLKVFDTDKRGETDWMIAHFPGIRTYDVIPVNGYLFMIGSDGFYLYDYSDITNIRQIGKIPVVSNV